MRKVLSGLGGLTIVAVAATGMYAAEAHAWTYQDCVDVAFDHPDCVQYQTTTTVPVTSTTQAPTTSTTIIRLIPPISVTAPEKPAPRIEEDSPGWDCRTMGNRICGPVPAPVRPVSLPHTL